MDPIEAIRDAQALGIELAPPLSTAGIDSLEVEFAHPLPNDLRRALGLAAAVAGAPLELDFTGRTKDVETGKLFPAGVHLAPFPQIDASGLNTAPSAVDRVPIVRAGHNTEEVLRQLTARRET
jgi:hypothetical protein